MTKCSKIKIKGRRKKAVFGEEVLAAGIQATATTLAAIRQAAATTAAAKETAAATEASAQKNAESLLKRNENDVKLQEKSAQVAKNNTEKENEVLQSMNETLLMQQGRENENQRLESARIQLKQGGKNNINTRIHNKLFSVIDGGYAKYRKTTPRGNILYELRGDDHEHYHKDSNGKTKTGVGIKLPNGKVIEGEGNQNTNQGEYMLVRPNENVIDFISKHTHRGFNGTEAINNGMEPEKASYIQENIKQKENMGNRNKFQKGGKTIYDKAVSDYKIPLMETINVPETTASVKIPSRYGAEQMIQQAKQRDYENKKRFGDPNRLTSEQALATARYYDAMYKQAPTNKNKQLAAEARDVARGVMNRNLKEAGNVAGGLLVGSVSPATAGLWAAGDAISSDYAANLVSSKLRTDKNITQMALLGAALAIPGGTVNDIDKVSDLGKFGKFFTKKKNRITIDDKTYNVKNLTKEQLDDVIANAGADVDQKTIDYLKYLRKNFTNPTIIENGHLANSQTYRQINRIYKKGRTFGNSNKYVDIPKDIKNITGRRWDSRSQVNKVIDKTNDFEKKYGNKIKSYKDPTQGSYIVGETKEESKRLLEKHAIMKDYLNKYHKDYYTLFGGENNKAVRDAFVKSAARRKRRVVGYSTAPVANYGIHKMANGIERDDVSIGNSTPTTSTVTKRNIRFKQGGRIKAANGLKTWWDGLSNEDKTNITGAGINTLGNMTGSLINNVGNRLANRYISKANDRAAGIMSDAYGKLQGIDLSKFNLNNIRKAHAATSLMDATVNTNPQTTAIDRDLSRARNYIDRNSVSSANKLNRFTSASTNAFDNKSKVFDAANKRNLEIREMNTNALNTTANENANRDIQSYAQQADMYLKGLQFNADVKNESILGMAQSTAKAITDNATSRATMLSQNASNLATGLTSSAKGINDSFIANAKNKHEFNSSWLGATSTNKYEYIMGGNPRNASNIQAAKDFINMYDTSKDPVHMQYIAAIRKRYNLN